MVPGTGIAIAATACRRRVVYGGYAQLKSRGGSQTPNRPKKSANVAANSASIAGGGKIVVVPAPDKHDTYGTRTRLGGWQRGSDGWRASHGHQDGRNRRGGCLASRCVGRLIHGEMAAASPRTRVLSQPSLQPVTLHSAVRTSSASVGCAISRSASNRIVVDTGVYGYFSFAASYGSQCFAGPKPFAYPPGGVVFQDGDVIGMRCNLDSNCHCMSHIPDGLWLASRRRVGVLSERPEPRCRVQDCRRPCEACADATKWPLHLLGAAGSRRGLRSTCPIRSRVPWSLVRWVRDGSDGKGKEASDQFMSPGNVLPTSFCVSAEREAKSAANADVEREVERLRASLMELDRKSHSSNNSQSDSNSVCHEFFLVLPVLTSGLSPVGSSREQALADRRTPPRS